MSIANCKCGKVFDSDFQMSHDEKGNCCCDECDMKMYEELKKHLHEIECPVSEIENIAEHLINLGYRKIN